MTWILTIVGALIGAAIGGWAGFFSLGFLGWIAGFIIKSNRQPVQPLAPPLTADARLQALEKRVAALERQLAMPRVASGSDPEPVVTAPIAEPVREPIAEVVVEPVPSPIASGSDPEERAPPPPPVPSEPNFIVKWFTGGNTIVRVGLVILFFGLAFLVKYGVDHEMIPVEFRVAAVAAAGIALLVLGWRLRGKRAGYALSMQGAGVAVLYLTIFGSLKLYHLLPAGMAFALLVIIAVLSAFLAIAQNSLALAVFGAAGGFLAPIFASTGGGSHVMLFSYYLVLNAGIVVIAWFRSWRVLNVVGFLFTFGIGLAWGVFSYRSELFDSTEPFLVAFFLMYVTIAILFARGQVAAHKSYVDGTIVFGVPIAAFGLQAGLMKGSEFGLAYSSLAGGALYIILATVLVRVAKERWQMLSESFLALGVVFVSLAIPLALDARWTSAAWALEGAAIVWMGVRQDRKLAVAFGVLLQLLAGLAFLKAWQFMPEGPPLANAVFIGAVLVSFAGLVTYRVLNAWVPSGSDPEGGSPSGSDPVVAVVASLFFIWGVVWWLGAGVHETMHFLDVGFQVNSQVAFIAATVLLFSLLGEREHWEAGQWPTWPYAPALLFLAFGSLIDLEHPFANMGWVAWPFAYIVHFAVLRRQQEKLPVAWTPWMHAIGAVTLAFLGAMEFEWLAETNTVRHSAWALSSIIVVPAALILMISSRRADDIWPVSEHTAAYRKGTVMPLVAVAGLWSLYINFEEAGASDPLPYLPFLNAIDLAHIFAGFAVVSAWMALKRSNLEAPKIFRGKLGVTLGSAVTFFWLNAVLLRTIHHWAGVEYDFDPLWDSVVVQTSLSIFWTVLALSLMVVATRLGRRAIWIVGAALMAVVVVKLLLVDLSHLGGIERIVSFIGVGVLMLVIGYFSPVPPKKVEVAA